eukprot:m.131312 g.131312  ORF g.131312 m.131312 type:complete len:1025 (-) comp13073_c1_seq1:110-3184(-)
MNPSLLLQALLLCNASVITCVLPTVLSSLLQFVTTQPEYLFPPSSSSLSTVCVGGEEFPRDIIRSCWNWNHPCTLWNIYGVSEAVLWQSLQQIFNPSSSMHRFSTIPIGSPILETISFKLAESHNDASNVEAQELVIESDVKVMIDGVKIHPLKIQTGDLVQRLPSGLTFVGRTNRMVKLFGKRTNLQVVSRQLLCFFENEKNMHPTNIECFKSSTIDNGINAVLAFAEYHGSNEVPISNCSSAKGPFHHFSSLCNSSSLGNVFLLSDDLLADLKTFAVQNCSVVVVNCFALPTASLPLTSSGKIRVSVLVEELNYLEEKLQRPKLTSSHFTSEEVLSLLWKVCFEHNVIEGDVDVVLFRKKSLSQLGGDSLVATSIASKLNQRFQFSLSTVLVSILSKSMLEVAEEISMLAKNNSDKLSPRTTRPYPKSIILHRTTSSTTTSSTTTIPSRSNHKIIPAQSSKQKTNTSNLLLKDEDEPTQTLRVQIQHGKCTPINGDWNCMTIQRALNIIACNSGDHHFNYGDAKVEDEAWSFNLGKCIDASPLVVAEATIPLNDVNGEIGIAIVPLRVYVGSHSHQFVCLDAHSGECVWKTLLPDRIESTACTSSCGRKIHVGCYDGNVYTLCSETGGIVGVIKTGDAVRSAIVRHPQSNFVFAGSYDGKLYVIDGSTTITIANDKNVENEPRFVLSCKNPSSARFAGLAASPCLVAKDGGGLLVITANLQGFVWCFQYTCECHKSRDKRDFCSSCKFDSVWNMDFRIPIFATPQASASSGVVVFATVDGGINCCSIKDGGLFWRQSLSDLCIPFLSMNASNFTTTAASQTVFAPPLIFSNPSSGRDDDDDDGDVGVEANPTKLPKHSQSRAKGSIVNDGEAVFVVSQQGGVFLFDLLSGVQLLQSAHVIGKQMYDGVGNEDGKTISFSFTAQPLLCIAGMNNTTEAQSDVTCSVMCMSTSGVLFQLHFNTTKKDEDGCVEAMPHLHVKESVVIDVRSPVFNSPCFVDNALFVGTRKDTLHCFILEEHKKES